MTRSPQVEHPVASGERQPDWLLDRTLFRCSSCGASTWVASCVHPHDTLKAARNLGLRVDDRFDTATGALLDESVLCRGCNVSARNVTRPIGRHRREPLGRLRTASSPLRF